jgi:hypothetical protein
MTLRDGKYTPAVPRYWLMLVAGLLWSGVGIALCLVACSWLSHGDWPQSGAIAALGASLGLLVHRFGFSAIAGRNIMRISRQPERACIFAFQAWPGYLLIIVMVFVGVVLRRSPLSRSLLALLYLTIGTGLALSSSLYYEELY